jgi:hypothetical protein
VTVCIGKCASFGDGTGCLDVDRGGGLANDKWAQRVVVVLLGAIGFWQCSE